MKNLIFVLCLLSIVCSALAVEKSVEVPTVGKVTLVAEKPDSWQFDLSADSIAAGVDVVRVKLRAPTAAVPPVFEVKWTIPQKDVHHFWWSESTHYGIPWGQVRKTEISNQMPLYSFLDANDGNRFTCACSESCRTMEFRSPVSETVMGFECSFRFFTVPEAPIGEYETEIRLDSRAVFYGEAIGAAADWMCAARGIVPLAVPESALDPLYSSWYTFHQDVSSELVEEELALAAQLGMKTTIVDDGWQIDLPLGNRAWGGYTRCGDWKAGRNFPEMAAHVRRAHQLGFKYMLWYSVPFVGEKSESFARFKGKYLPGDGHTWRVLDPRFPEVREYLIGIYEKAVREWDLDGFKLDFIGRFTLRGEDPAIAENYAGRDIKSVPLAVERLLTDAMARLKALKPDILIEFRQPYIGPCIRAFGNMIRAADCPLSMVENRTRIARLRLTSGKTAVHADMLEWRNDETAESAARFILNSLFGVVQYSVRLKTLPESHRRMLAHWIRFSQEHREALLKGRFTPRYPAADYPVLEGESAAERVIGVYQPNLAVSTGVADRPVIVMNGANADSLLVDFTAAPCRVEAFDTYGERVPTDPVAKSGVCRVKVPVSGYLKITWRHETAAKPLRFMTFNIFGSGYSGFEAAEREDRAIEVVRAAKPDLVSWQEVNAGWWSSKLFTTMDEFGVVRGDEDEALVRAGANLAERRDNWVNHEPLMYRKSRLKLLDSGLDFYHVSIQFEKSLTWAVLEDLTDGRRFIAFATHFWWQENGPESDAIRELNARHVLNRLETIKAKWGDLPVVGGGDLNCEKGALALKTFGQFGFSDAGETAPERSTVPSYHGRLRRDAAGKCRGEVGVLGRKGHCMLDHVLYAEKDFSPIRHAVITDRDAIDISDHSPVVVDLNFSR